jgi:hypothetical protein
VTITNPTIGYRCEFDTETAQSKVVVILRSENGGATEVDFSDLTAANNAAIMLNDAADALQRLVDNGFEEGIALLGFEVDEDTEFTIEDILGE